MKIFKKFLTPLLAIFLVLGFTATNADETHHKLVIQVSTDDARTQMIAMNNL